MQDSVWDLQSLRPVDIHGKVTQEFWQEVWAVPYRPPDATPTTQPGPDSLAPFPPAQPRRLSPHGSKGDLAAGQLAFRV